MQDETTRSAGADAYVPDALTRSAARAARQEEAPLPITRKELERIVAYLEVQIADLDRREQQVNSELAALDSERRSLRLEAQQFEQRIREQDEMLTEREHQVATGHSAVEQLSEQLRHEQEQIIQERRRLAADQAKLQEAQESWRDECEREIADRREELDQRESQLARQLVDLEKRARFHDEHLAKLRGDLDRQQRELAAAAQQRQARRVEEELQIQRRLAQLRRFRDSLEQQESATERRADPDCAGSDAA